MSQLIHELLNHFECYSMFKTKQKKINCPFFIDLISCIDYCGFFSINQFLSKKS